jgi:hypothetical protein
MTLGDLLVLYGAAGLVSASVAYRAAPERSRAALAGAALTIPIWPLWLPVVLASRRSLPGKARTHDATQSAIWEAHEAVLGTPLEPLLPRDQTHRMLAELQRAAQRHLELTALLARSDFDPRAAEERVTALEACGATPRGLAPARLHLENVRRLDELRRRDEQTLVELGELAMTLRAQLILARYAGSAPADANDVLSEVWARVEVLGTTLETPQTVGRDTGYGSDEARLASG